MRRSTMTEPSERRVIVGMYSLLSPDPQRLASFWSQLMGLPIADGANDDLVMLDFDHEVTSTTWIIQRSTDAPSGPSPVALDLGIENADESSWREAADRAEALGAVRVGEQEHDGVRWIDLRDPDGNRFRVFAPRPQ